MACCGSAQARTSWFLEDVELRAIQGNLAEEVILFGGRPVPERLSGGVAPHVEQTVDQVAEEIVDLLLALARTMVFRRLLAFLQNSSVVVPGKGFGIDVFGPVEEVAERVVGIVLLRHVVRRGMVAGGAGVNRHRSGSG